MSQADLERWRFLLSHDAASLRAAAAAVGRAPTPADIMRLRRTWDAGDVSLALQLADARRRAGPKFTDVDRLALDREGAEQASSSLAAMHKAARFASIDAPHVVDLCCGVGGDAMALARVARVTGVDRDPVRAWMCAHNAGCEIKVGDVETFDLDADLDADVDAIHIDPARRTEGPDGRRVWRLEDARPGPAFLASLLAQGRPAAVKLGPGVDLGRAAALAGDQAAEIEIISERGRLTQAILWTGELAAAPGMHRATLLDAPDDVRTLVGPPEAPGTETPPDSFLFTVDPSVERAGLLPRLAADTGLAIVHPALGLLTGPEVIPSSWLTPFRVLDTGPWRRDRVRSTVAALGAGVVEVKTRGGAADPDVEQHALRGDGDRSITVFVLRMGTAVHAFITERVSS